MIATSKLRRSHGNGIAEAGVAMAVLIPLFLVLLHITVEVAKAYLIKSTLTAAANRAVREMSIKYWQDHTIATNRSIQDTLVFDKVRIDSMVVNSQQFSDANFDLVSDPPVVSVTVTYTGGKYGLAPYPDPDPLALGSSYLISSTVTHALE